jgi:hypothetical protein
MKREGPAGKIRNVRAPAHSRAPHLELTPWRANVERFTLLPRLLPKPSRSDRSRRRRSAPEPLPRPPSQSVATRSVEQHSMVTKPGIDAVLAEKAAGEGPSLGRPNGRARMVTGSHTDDARSLELSRSRSRCLSSEAPGECSRTFVCRRRSRAAGCTSYAETHHDQPVAVRRGLIFSWPEIRWHGRRVELPGREPAVDGCWPPMSAR